MRICNIFVPDLFAFEFDNANLNEYDLAMKQWLDTEYLHHFYNENLKFIEGNPFFPIKGREEFSNFIIENAVNFDEKIEEASAGDDLSKYFIANSKGVNIYEILPYKKAKQQVLRLYAIKLGDVYIICGSAIKLTEENDGHPSTKRQMIKVQSVQDFLLGEQINDEESFFYYIDENTDYD